MKVQKLISLDLEIMQRLKQEDNASALVNALLNSHYKDNRSEEQIIAEVKEGIKAKQEVVDKDSRIRDAVRKRVKEMEKHKIKGIRFDGEKNLKKKDGIR